MAAPRFQHSIQVPDDLEQAWLSYHAANPELSFNGFACDVLRAALTNRLDRDQTEA